LGVSVLCVCENVAEVPTTSETLIDLEMKTPPEELATVQTDLPQASIRTLQPDPPPVTSCDQLDVAPLEALQYLAQRMQPLWVASTKRLEIRVQADLRRLFEPPLDLYTYDPPARWSDPFFRMHVAHKGEMPNMRIPIGLKIADEVQYLDFLKDGPHGLMIGQTGSGKSELLQTVITSLAVAYLPTEVNFLLIDYKAGLALEPFRRLPHTVGFLSNVSSPALIQRFITMLKAEATRREMEMKKGVRLPRLIIIIDEFAEMAKRTEAVLDELFTITRVGREIGMHLLLAAQRPEGIIATKVRDYVQYRLCLRCASPEDSREVLRRPDAANLPASIPGRGYLLHGDNQLDLFQAARVALTITLNQTVKIRQPSLSLLPSINETTTTTSLAEALIEEIHSSFSREEAQKAGIIYWPDPLPTPITHQAPDPLTLFKENVDSFAGRNSASGISGEQAQNRVAVVPTTLSNMLSIPKGNNTKPSMQIPLGLIDKPEVQKRETFLVDLHGSSGALTGGPLLIAGAQHSGKATALETLLFWLLVRYSAQQLNCAIIDPVQEFDYFQDMPQMKASDDGSLWTDGSTDEDLKKFVEGIMEIIDTRKSDFPNQRWDSNTLAQLWALGIEVPQLLVVIHHYHSFADRINAMATLKKLSLAAMEARNMGVYLVVTTAEVGGRYIPADLLSKFATKVGLFLNEQQRFDLFGRPPLVPDLIPGRGLAQTPDRSIHQVQFALPVAGETESERREMLKQVLNWLQSQ
ncbi:MAG TPA: FtsK/SpoIIIE domain-containing protein, partial [Ktedonobacteraceae bacterium]|nr:FtsK/SpoIIIE domain-containing protein [Ktedonobacteraceae bacterium]